MTHDPCCPVLEPGMENARQAVDDEGRRCPWCALIVRVRYDAAARSQDYSRGFRAGYREGRQDAAIDVADELRHGPNPHLMLACMPPMQACTGCARGWPHPVDPVGRAAGKPTDHNRRSTPDVKGNDL